MESAGDILGVLSLAVNHPDGTTFSDFSNHSRIDFVSHHYHRTSEHQDISPWPIGHIII